MVDLGLSSHEAQRGGGEKLPLDYLSIEGIGGGTISKVMFGVLVSFTTRC